MPRAHRHYIPGCIWHITHRCHKQEFLLKFEKDRKRWRYWIYEAKKRYGLCVLNDIVTSNHIHLLVVDTDKEVIPKSLQLIAGRTAQEYNLRKNCKGAFWEDRYHATAVETDEHFAKCLVYIDLNMVRAGVVRHPRENLISGFSEIQNTPMRYGVIDRKGLLKYLAMPDHAHFQQVHRQWVEAELHADKMKRKTHWSESIAVGSERFVEKIKSQLGHRAKGRSLVTEEEGSILKEAQPPYNTLSEGEKQLLYGNKQRYYSVIPWSDPGTVSQLEKFQIATPSTTRVSNPRPEMLLGFGLNASYQRPIKGSASVRRLKYHQQQYSLFPAHQAG